jgi:hypothetical protein
MHRKLGLLFLLAWLPAFAQTTVRGVPNCTRPFTLDADGNSNQLDNRGLGCNVWAVVFEKFGGAGAGTVTFQAARSNASGGETGLTWATFPSAAVIGTNPETAVFASVWFVGGAPFVRVNVSGLDSTLRGNIWGWVATPGAASSGGGGATSNVDIVASIPLTVSQAQVCTTHANISFTGTGNNQVIAASGALTPIICSIILSSDTSTTLTITRGTGANCGTGTATMATFPALAGVALDPQANLSTFSATASSAICVGSSVSATVGGIVFYRYQ